MKQLSELLPKAIDDIQMKMLFKRHLRATNQWVDKDHARTLFDAVRGILVSDTAFRHYLVASYQLNIPISEGRARNYFDAVEKKMKIIKNKA
jgi:hypothetical protein